MNGTRTLRPHQQEAVEAAVKALDAPPGGIPRQGLRATVVAACGTGKTVMAAHAARRLVGRRGRVLVVLPTLDLLRQTVRVWQAEGHTGPSVAVCSTGDDPQLWQAGVCATTNPVRLGLWHGEGPVTVYATYASLGVLQDACDGAFGQQLAGFDLAVVDEAHRTSGSWGKAWVAIHDQHAIPCARRLYLTATPRIWTERPASHPVREGQRQLLPNELACSMDDPTIFGEHVYELGLAEAVSRGLLARYQILVAEIRDRDLSPADLAGQDRREEHVRGKRLGALQAALVRTMADHHLSTVLTFHHRTVEAEAFAAGLPKVARQLHAADPDRYPRQVSANWLSGAHASDQRARVLHELETTAHPAVLSNCRVLGEGVDAPAVDAVALLDPKGSPVEIVQAIGRALRQQPGQGKRASLIVPVFVDDEDKEEDLLTSASYQPLVTVLHALRAHDERALDMLAIPQENTPRSPTETLGAAGEEDDSDTADSRILLRFSVPKQHADVAALVRWRVWDTERDDFTRGLAAARDYAHREGHLRVPLNHTEQRGSFPLGRWIRRQRAAHAAGELTGTRHQRLEELGMVWDPGEADWHDNLDAAHAYHAQHGTLCPPRGATALDKPVGQWLANCRRPGSLSAERAAQLAAIDPDWNPPWSPTWQRHYTALRQLVETGTGVDEILPGVTVDGTDIGRWLTRQHARWNQLHQGQQQRLTSLSAQPTTKDPNRARQSSSGPHSPTTADTPADGPAHGLAGESENEATARAAPATGQSATGRPTTGPSDRQETAWWRNLAAVHQYRDREGHLHIPRSHVEHVADADGTQHALKPGVWLSNQRSRRHQLPTHRATALAEMGV